MRANAYAIWVAAMAQALERRDEAAFQAALAQFDALRDTDVMTGVRKVALDLQSALDRFREDSRLVELAERQVPDARHRLAHVLRLTDDAAHRTMDLVEACCPLADQAAREAQTLLAGAGAGAGAGADSRPLLAYVQQTATTMATVRANLAEVLLAQGYQDLSGQIIRGIMGLVDQLEVALRELVRITGTTQAIVAADTSPARGVGPVIPGISFGATVNGQQDIDALLSDLGV